MAAKRVRMTGIERREQLISVARSLFAQRGFDATSVEEIASHAGVTKPVVYEHFGGKEGLYAVIVDREVLRMVDTITQSLTKSTHPREIVEHCAFALLDYIEEHTDGFRVLVRDAPSDQSGSSYSSVMNDVASKVEHLMASKFSDAKYDTKWAPLYAQMLVGLIAQVGEWWLEERSFKKEVVVAHIVNLTWVGMRHLNPQPTLLVDPKTRENSSDRIRANASTDARR